MCVFVCVRVCCHSAVSEEVLLDLSDVLKTDPHILGTGRTGTDTPPTTTIIVLIITAVCVCETFT